jgi:hypothetical protein
MESSIKEAGSKYRLSFGRALKNIRAKNQLTHDGFLFGMGHN